MPWMQDIKRRASVQKAVGPGPVGRIQVGTLGAAQTLTGDRIKDAAVLRDWRETTPLVNRGVNLKKRDVANEPWQIGPQSLNHALSKKQQTIADEITAFLRAPNATMENNSFGGLIEPFVDDLFTVGMGAILKKPLPGTKQRPGGIPGALETLDAARVGLNDEWDGSETSPRYFYLSEDQRTKKPLLNSELITCVLNPTSYSPWGIAPLRVLYRTLTAYRALFARLQAMQQHGGPAKMVNIAGAGRENLATIRRRHDNEVAPNSAVMFTDFDIDDVSVFDLGSPDLRKVGTFEAHDIYVREIAACLDVAPFYLMQEQDTHLSSAAEQGRMTMDDGLPPILRLVAGYLTREIIACWGDPELAFQHPALLDNDEPEGAEAIRERFGQSGSWLSINAALIADGLEPLPSTGDPVVDAWLNEPRVAVAPGGVTAPISVAAKLSLFAGGPVDETATQPVESSDTPAAAAPPAAKSISPDRLAELPDWRARVKALQRSVTTVHPASPALSTDDGRTGLAKLNEAFDTLIDRVCT